MKRKIVNTILLIFLFFISCLLIWKYTPLSGNYLYNKGKQLYKLERYEEAASIFEEALISDSDNPAYRYFYVSALLKMKPVFSVQQKLYKIAHSKPEDSAQQLAKSQMYRLKKELIGELDENYIYNAISSRDIIRWNIEDFPLKVYIQKTDKVPKYYIENIKTALEEWEKRTGFIEFHEVENEKDSNISVIFNDYTQDCQSENCQYVVATTEHKINSNNRLEKMVISFYKTNPYGEPYFETEVYHAALHEIGHALGIMGHSDNSSDIMYSNNHEIFDVFESSRPQTMNFSIRDLKTIALLYKINPTITNSTIINIDQYLYAPLILGADEELLKSKLAEFEKYIRNYPNFSGGYINISSIYSEMGEYDKALSSLNRAMELASNDDERFLVEHNRAMIYYNMHNVEKSREHAKNALKIKEDENLYQLLEELEKF